MKPPCNPNVRFGCRACVGLEVNMSASAEEWCEMNMTMPWNAQKPAKNGWSAPIDDVKQQIGQQVDHLVQVASQISRDTASQAATVTSDVGAQAATAARDLGGQALKVTQDAGGQAAAVAREVPGGANSLLQQILNGAARLGREARAVRITREPPQQQKGPDVVPGIALLAGVGGGLALMYFFDPGEGRRRRALLRDQFTKWMRIGRETATGRAKDVRNRTAGLAHEAHKAVMSRSGMDHDMHEIASGSDGNGYGYSSPTYPEQPTSQTSDQPLTSEVG
jgi:hypothetical protein